MNLLAKHSLKILPKPREIREAWRKKPNKAVSSSSEHLVWSYLERDMGGRKIVAGGGLFV